MLSPEKLGGLASYLLATAEQQLSPSDEVCALQPATAYRH